MSRLASPLHSERRALIPQFPLRHRFPRGLTVHVAAPPLAPLSSASPFAKYFEIAHLGFVKSMRTHICLAALIAMLTCGGCVESRYVSIPGPGPSAIPPAPHHPKIEGHIDAVSAADIREVLRLKHHDMVNEYGRSLPVYTVRVHSKNHIEVQYWDPEGVEVWRDARRVKGRWKFDALATGRIILGAIDAGDLTEQWSQPRTVRMLESVSYGRRS